ncbi:MAG: DNA primase [Verrucomicrobia bacterium]|nr:DNA primase [Verrucomicrobiota bacterium]
MAVSRQVLDDIRARIDIVDFIGSYVPLKRAGANYKGLCPFHREKSPSFTVHQARQIFHCFGCGAGGDIFKFTMQHESVDFMEAVRILAQRAGVELHFTEAERSEETRKDTLYRVHEEVARFYHDVLLEHSSAAVARQYLGDRDLGPDVIKDFYLGYAPGGFDILEQFAKKNGFSIELLETAGLVARNEQGRRYDRFRDRLMFPIRDLTGRIIAFSGRILGKDDRAAKYLNSPETPLFRKSRTLFAMDRARKSIIESRTCMLCEGQIDVIRCHLAGFTNAVAALGTALTDEHAMLIKRHADRVLLVMDADSAGQNSALRSAEIFLGAELSVDIAPLPIGEDPDSLIVKKGAEAFRAQLDKTRSVVNFQVDVLAARENIAQEAGLRRVVAAALETIRHSASEVQRSRMLQELSARVGLTEGVLRSELRRTAPQSARATPDGNERSTHGASQPAPPPPDERELIQLLINSPEQCDLVRQFVQPLHFTDARCSAIYSAILKGQTGDDLISAAREESDECVALTAQLIASDRRIGDTEELCEKAAQDLIISVRRKEIERNLRAVTQRRASATPEEQQRLTEEIAGMKYDLVALRSGWDKASLILE